MTPVVVVPTLTLLLGIQPISTDLCLPALPTLQREFGASLSATQLNLSTPIICFGLLVCGRLADRFGRRQSLLTGLVPHTVASVLGAVAQSIEALIVWRAHDVARARRAWPDRDARADARRPAGADVEPARPAGDAADARSAHLSRRARPPELSGVDGAAVLQLERRLLPARGLFVRLHQCARHDAVPTPAAAPRPAWRGALGGAALFAVGHGIHQPCGQSGVVGPFPERAGTAASVSGFAMMATAFAISPWLGRAPLHSVFPVTLGIGACSIVLALNAWTLVQRHSDAHAGPAAAQPAPI